MDFDKQKQKTLVWKDNSKKGSYDHHIRPLLNTINKKDNFYTTSSCAGRIDVINLSPSLKKHQSEWLVISHDPLETKIALEIIKKLDDAKDDSETWFKMESAIIHVCCKTIDDAVWMLQKAKEAGFKHSGILSVSKRIIIEVFGSEKIETIIARGKTLICSKDYLDELTIASNKKLKITRERIKKLNQLIQLKSSISSKP